MAEPLCRHCLEQGRYVPSEQVHHVRAIKHGGSLLDPSNLVPLCLACHQQETAAGR